MLRSLRGARMIARRLRLPGAPLLAQLQTIPLRTKLTYVDSPMGIVDSVMGDSVIVQSLSGATPYSLVTFQNGSSGLVTEIRRDGSLRVGMLNGTPGHNQTAVVEPKPLTVTASTAYFGRVVDALGQPLDGLGPVEQAAGRSRVQAVLSAVSPSIPSRGPRTAALPTGYKAVDGFFPLVRGQAAVVLGERGVGKTRFALDVVSTIGRVNAAIGAAVAEADEAEAEAAAAATPAPVSPLAATAAELSAGGPVRVVYVAVGASVAGIKDVVRHLRATGALPYTAIVAAPATAHVGMQFLAPFTGAALAEYVRDTGGHALLVVDDLSAHFSAARRVSGVDWLRTGAAPTNHGALFDRCAQLNAAHGGGSMSLLGLLDALPSGPNYTAMEHIKVREMVSNTCSLADTVIPLSTHAVKATTLLPIELEELVVRTGHAGQGAALRHYANRARELLCELRETARGVQTATMLGVEAESDTDAPMDLHTKARLLLLPTHTALRAAMDAAVDDDAGAIRQLGLEGLQYGKRGATAVSAARPDDSLEDGDGEEGDDALSAQLSAVVKAAGGGTRSRSGSKSSSSSGAAPQKQQARSFSTSATAGGSSSGGSGGSGGNDDDKQAKLMKKMDPVQLRTLMAIRAGKERKSGAALAAKAAFTGGAAPPPPAPPAAPGAAARARPATGSGSGFGGPMTDFSALYGRPGGGSGAAAGAGASARAGTSASARAAVAEAEEEAPARRTTADMQSIFDGVEEEEDQEEAQKAAARGVKPTKPSGTSGSGSGGGMGGAGSRSYSTSAALCLAAATEATPAERLPFRAPTGRAPPAQIFADVMAPVRAGDEAAAEEEAAAAAAAAAEESEGRSRRLRMWEDAPHRGDPARLLLTLFLLTHGYTQRVPVSKLFQYEAGLLALLAAVPAPEQLVAAKTRGKQQQQQQQQQPAVPLNGSGFHRAPAATAAGGQRFVSLLDAAVSAPVPAPMACAARLDLHAALREATLAFVRRSATIAQASRAADEAAAAAARAERAASDAVKASTKRSWWRTLTGSAVTAEGAVLPPATTMPSPPAAEAVYAEDPQRVSDIAAHLRLDASTSLYDLPPVWQAVHVAVAEYTRRFNGEPIVDATPREG